MAGSLMPHWAVATFVFLTFVFPAGGAERDAGQPPDKVKEIAGKSEFLRAVPKHFGTLVAVNSGRRRITLLIDGERLPKVWELTPDAEVKVQGWWGRLDQLTVGDRVWAWFETNRSKEPVAVFMLADELSEQDMHGPGVKIEAIGATGQLTFQPAKGKSETRQADKARVYRKGSRKDGPLSLASLTVGMPVYVQSAGDRARLIFDAEGFEEARSRQKAALRQRWADKGLPGTVVFLHRFTGELELMLDHEAMRWGRSLKPGDSAMLASATPIKVVVKQGGPWRERTRLRLVAAADDLADLAIGQRLRLRMTPPAVEVDNSPLPPDLDRPRSRAERIEWFLASIYCACPIKGDGCTGQFYSLASCNPNGCGQPNRMRKLLAEKIDRGLTDRQIFDELLREQGPGLLRPHLLP